jgi:hypothetical protein
LTVLCGVAGAQAPEERAAGRVTLDLREVPLAAVLEALFTQAGLPYAVEPNTPGVLLTLRLTDVDFPTALRAVLRLAGATSRQENGVTFIGPRVRERVAAAPDYYLAPQPAPRAAAEQAWEKIPLRYISVELLVAVLGGGVVPPETQLFGGGGPFISTGTGTWNSYGGFSSGSMSLGPLGSGNPNPLAGAGGLGMGPFGNGYGGFGDSYGGFGGGFPGYGGMLPGGLGVR